MWRPTLMAHMVGVLGPAGCSPGGASQAPARDNGASGGQGSESAAARGGASGGESPDELDLCGSVCVRAWAGVLSNQCGDAAKAFLECAALHPEALSPECAEFGPVLKDAADTPCRAEQVAYFACCCPEELDGGSA